MMRTVLMVGISYDDDPQRAVDIVLDTLRGYEAVVDNPGPKMLVWEFAYSAVMPRI